VTINQKRRGMDRSSLLLTPGSVELNKPHMFVSDDSLSEIGLGQRHNGRLGSVESGRDESGHGESHKKGDNESRTTYVE